MTPQFNCRLRKTTQDAITANAKKAGQTIDEYLTQLVTGSVRFSPTKAEIEKVMAVATDQLEKGQANYRPAFGKPNGKLL